MKSNKNIDQQNEQVSRLWLHELKRSHFILENLIRSVPSERRKEFIELLQTLAEGVESGESASSAQQKALQIVTVACKQDQYEPERRTAERRQNDRRQQAPNSGRPWTTEQIRILHTLAEQNVPIRRISRKLGRSSTAIESKAKKIKVSVSHIK